MSDPGKSVPSEVRYQVELANGPCKFTVHGKEFVLGSGEDAPVLVRTVWSSGFKIEETIVGIIGGRHSFDTREFLKIQSFLNHGGVIGLHRDLIT